MALWCVDSMIIMDTADHASIPYVKCRISLFSLSLLSLTYLACPTAMIAILYATLLSATEPL